MTCSSFLTAVSRTYVKIPYRFTQLTSSLVILLTAVAEHDPFFALEQQKGYTWDALAADLNEIHGWGYLAQKITDKVYRLVSDMKAGNGRLLTGIGRPKSGTRDRMTPVEQALKPIFDKRMQCE
jgi:hypothetical protein